MKKYIVLFAALAACTVVSCNKEIKETPIDNNPEEVIPTTPARRTVTITAEVDPETKTFYEGGTNFSWTTGDKISILTYNSSTGDYKYEEFTANSTAPSSKFTGYLDDGYELSDIALFPANSSHGYTSGASLPIQFYIPKEKDLTSNNSADLPMVAEKSSGNVYAFKHCSGATKITIDNIPAKYTSVTVSFKTRDDQYGVKISGTLDTRKRSSGFFAWDASYAENDNDKTFSRIVPVTSNSATVYIPFATGGTIYSNNTVSITGHDGVNDDLLYSNSSVGEIAGFTRATVIPLATLHMNNLKSIDWSASGVYTFGSSGYIDEWKATSDTYYIYFRVKIAASQVAAGRYIYTGFNTNGKGRDGVASPWGTGMNMDGDPSDMEALTLVYPFSAVEAETITFKDGVDSDGFIQHPVRTSVGKVTTWGYQEGNLSTGYAYIVIAINRAKIGSPDGTITVEHSYRSSPSLQGEITLN